MIYAIYFVHVLVSIFLILVVLLQQGKGADLSVFGGGGTQTAFGARGAATVLHKLTVTCFILFLVTTVTLGIMSSGGGSSVMEGVAGAADEVEEAAPTDGPAGGTLEELDGDGSADAASDGETGDSAPAEDTDPPGDSVEPPAEEDGTDG